MTSSFGIRKVCGYGRRQANPGFVVVRPWTMEELEVIMVVDSIPWGVLMKSRVYDVFLRTIKREEMSHSSILSRYVLFLGVWEKMLGW